MIVETIFQVVVIMYMIVETIIQIVVIAIIVALYMIENWMIMPIALMTKRIFIQNIYT